MELGLRCANGIDYVQVHRRNRSLRNSQNPPENESIKATNVYVPEDILQSSQISAIMMSPAVPLALRFQKQGQFGEKFDHHVPLAPVDVYKKVDGTFRKAAAEPRPVSTHAH